MNKINTKLSPFKLLCLQSFPFIEADFDALTNYELMCKIVEYLNKTIEQQNITGENVNILLNWFNNLDVQDEINNKLDSMAESGELQEIISTYLNSKAIFGFQTVSDMKNADNLINGSHAKTYGFYNLFDGGGANYLISDTASDDVLTIELNNGKYAILEIEKPLIKAKQIGIHADKTTDDKELLQKIIDYCKQKNYTLEINGYSYVSDTIDTKGIKIVGIGKPSDASAVYISHRFGNIGWDYLNNVNNGALITFNDYSTDVLKTGSGIISDVANPIIKCKNRDGKFNLENLTICGWLRNNNQEGVLSTYENDDDTYINGGHKFKDVYIINCGNNGLHLQSLEIVNPENLRCDFNFGYGCLIEGVNGFDTPFEYVELKSCKFNGNKLGGFYALNTFRKQVRFINCQSNSSGLYHQMNISLPNNTEDIIPGFKIEGKESSSGANREILIFDTCYGEETDKLIDIRLGSNNKITNSIDIHNCLSYPEKQSNLCCLAYVDVYYCNEFSFYNNFFNGANQLLLSNNINELIPLIVDNNYYSKYNNIPSNLNINSKLTISNQYIKRYGNMVNVCLNAVANDTINAYENLITSLPKPEHEIQFVSLIGTSTGIAYITTNRQCACNKTLNNNDRIVFNVTYFTSLTNSI